MGCTGAWIHRAPQKPLELILARNLLTSISTPAFLLDDEAAVVFYNEAAAALLGRSFEEAGRMEAEQWTHAFGPFDEDGSPVEVDALATTEAIRSRPAGACDVRDPDRARARAADRGERLPDRRLRAGLLGRDDPLLAPRERRTGTAMKLKVWGARGSVPAPGPHMNRYGGNTSCVQLTLAERRGADPRRRYRDPQPRASTSTRAAGSTSCSPTCTSTTSRD